MLADKLGSCYQEVIFPLILEFLPSFSFFFGWICPFRPKTFILELLKLHVLRLYGREGAFPFRKEIPWLI